MMTGIVTAQREAVLRLTVYDINGQPHDLDAVIDTGYNGYVTLPPAMIAMLGLPSQRTGRAILADGSERTFNVYESQVQ